MGRPRILVIDDETEFRQAIAQALTLDGYDVETALDGREGATLVCRHPYDLIFCDLRMPKVDGRGLRGDPAAVSPRAQAPGVCDGPGALPGLRAVPPRDRDAGPAEAVHDSPAPGRRGPDGRAGDSEASRDGERLPSGRMTVTHTDGQTDGQAVARSRLSGRSAIAVAGERGGREG